MRGQSKLLILVLGSACQVENKLLDIAPHTIAGECNLESPPVVPDSEKPIAVCNSNRFSSGSPEGECRFYLVLTLMIRMGWTSSIIGGD